MRITKGLKASTSTSRLSIFCRATRAYHTAWANTFIGPIAAERTFGGVISWPFCLAAYTSGVDTASRLSRLAYVVVGMGWIPFVGIYPSVTPWGSTCCATYVTALRLASASCNNSPLAVLCKRTLTLGETVNVPSNIPRPWCVLIARACKAGAPSALP